MYFGFGSEPRPLPFPVSYLDRTNTDWTLKRHETRNAALADKRAGSSRAFRPARTTANESFGTQPYRGLRDAAHRNLVAGCVVVRDRARGCEMAAVVAERDPVQSRGDRLERPVGVVAEEPVDSSRSGRTPLFLALGLGVVLAGALAYVSLRNPSLPQPMVRLTVLLPERPSGASVPHSSPGVDCRRMNKSAALLSPADIIPPGGYSF